MTNSPEPEADGVTRLDHTADCGIEAGDLWDWIDRADTDVTNASQIEAHLESCPHCQARVRDMQGLHGALEAIKTEEDLLPQSIGPYRVVRKLGHGGMGVVYEARQATPARSVAVKVMRPSGATTEHQLRSFRREIEALGRLNHPSIATVFDAGRTDDGQLYLVMEMVEGECLDAFCDRQAAGVRERVEAVLQIAEAVQYAHEHGVIHRDLKPGNLFVDKTGRPRVLDFGLARFLEPELDVTSSPSLTLAPSGTLPYMSPEQLAGDTAAIAAPSDVYSLGVVLYQLLTKLLPYDTQQSVSDMQRVIAQRDARHPSYMVDVARELGDVVMKAIEKDRKRRYANMDEFAKDLRNFLAGRSVGARPPTVAYRTRVLARRHWRSAAIASIVLASLVTAMWPRESAAAPRTERLTFPGGVPEIGRMPPSFDFANDGRRVAFDPGSHDRIRLWDRDLGILSDILRAPRETNYFQPRWSPDARRIAFLENRQVDGVLTCNVLVLELASGELRRVHETRIDADRAWDCRWLPAGKGLVCLRLDGSMFSVTLDGKMTRWSSARMQKPHKIRALSDFSPDGKWLLVDGEEWADGSNRVENQDVWCIPFGGGRASRLTFGEDRNRHPIWHPDGSVWFASNRPSKGPDKRTFNLWRLAVEPHSGLPDGPPEQMSFEATGEKTYPRFLNDGRDVVYRVAEGIELLNCASFDGRRIVGMETVGKGREPDLSPDGQTIFHLDGNGGPGLFAMDRASRVVRQITGDAIVARDIEESPVFGVSPDGRHIAYATESDEGHQVRVVPTDGAPDASPTVVDVTDMMPTPPRWSPDGKWIAHAANGVVRVVSADGRTRRALAAIWQWHGVAWSPKGDALAGLGYASPQTEDPDGNDTIEAFLVTFPEGKCTQITHELRYKEWLRWHPSGSFLTYHRISDIRRAYPDGRPTDVMIDQEGHYDYRGEWTPDGKYFLFRSWHLPGQTKCPSLLHVWELETERVVEHGLMGDWPRFDAAGKDLVWSGAGGTAMHYFEIRRGIAR